MEPTNIINVHTHTFNRRNVPVKFLPAFLRPVADWLENRIFSNILAWIAEKLLRQKQYASLIKKYHSFLKIGDGKTQEDVLKELIAQYPIGTKFCILTMDMEYMGAGPVPQPFEEQLRELAMLKRDPRYRKIIYPFIFAHPERPNILEIVKHYIEVENFTGIKLYPPIGYYPFDERLDKIMAYAEKNRIPITTHCSRGGVFYRGKITDAMRLHPITGERLPKTDNKTFCQHFTDPANYECLLKKFPNLVLNLAHFGGGSEWLKYLDKKIFSGEDTWLEKAADLMVEYPNVYADISYTMYDPRLFPQLKAMLQLGHIRYKILFGSDFYMVEREIAEREFFLKLRAFLGEDHYPIIANINPRVFLGIVK